MTASRQMCFFDWEEVTLVRMIVIRSYTILAFKIVHVKLLLLVMRDTMHGQMCQCMQDYYY